ncbi:MAG: hypothetical protein CMM45_01545 [Rhodospirillaceae bacterium]|nr:hypothetical protein [Rhodospirillaceae bacterium]
MRSQTVRIFDYDDNDRQYLFMKSLYIPDDFDNYKHQSKFGQKVAKIGKFDFSQYAPLASVLDEYVRENFPEIFQDWSAKVNCCVIFGSKLIAET